MAKISSFHKIISFLLGRAFCYFAIMMFQMSLLFFGFFLGLVCVHTTTDQAEDQLRKIFNMEYFDRSKIINALTSGAKPPVDLELLDDEVYLSIDVRYTKADSISDDFFYTGLYKIKCEFQKIFVMYFSSFMLKGEGNVSWTGNSYRFKINFPVKIDIETFYSKGKKRTYVKFLKTIQPHAMTFEIIGQLPKININVLKEAAIEKMHALIYQKLVVLNAIVDITTASDFCFAKRHKEDCYLEFKSNGTELNVTGINFSNVYSMVVIFPPLSQSGLATKYWMEFADIAITQNKVMLKDITYFDISGTLNSSDDIEIEIDDNAKFGKTIKPIIRNGIKFFIEQLIPKSSKSISADEYNIIYFSWSDERTTLLVFIICVLLAHPLASLLKSASKLLAAPGGQYFNRTEMILLENIEIEV